MVLSWLQNFFNMFTKDEEEQLHENEIYVSQNESHISELKNTNKDLDTRIAYQYPKGRFRFPIIPDEKNSQPVDKVHQAKPSRQEPPKPVYKEIRKKEISPAKVKKDPLPKIRNTRPFRPTEIPSPIFGFQRPASDGKIVEHELSQFEPITIENSLEKGPLLSGHHNVAIKESVAEAQDFVRLSPEAENEKPVLLNMGVAAAAIDTTEEPVGWKANLDVEVSTPASLMADASCAADESKDIPGEVSSALELAAEAENELEAEIKVGARAEIDGETETKAEYEPELELESELEPEMEPVPEPEMGPEPEPDLDSEPEMEAEPEPDLDLEPEMEREPQPDSESETEAEIETDPESDFSQDQSNQGTPSRRHLPFNVMMLKSDKQKWEARKMQVGAGASNRIEPNVELAEKEIISVVEQDEKDLSLFQYPGFELLSPPVTETMDIEWVEMQTELLNQTLQNFNVGAKVVNVTQGPAVTRFEVQPEPGVKVNKVTNLSDDIKLSLAARDIRIEAPIPGKHTIGIEVPNQKSRPVFISEIIQSEIFEQSSSPLTAVLGLDISGKPIVTDLKKMPHGLIAGATGSGKSVCINSILVSLLYKASPEELKLLLIDPKMVELAPYNRIPHLVSPVITDVKAATAALKWAVEEMERRYELFAHTGVRDINRFNEMAVQHERYADKLPFIVIVIDELADLMMMSPADVEEAICRIAQKARACGIHLIIATQRPSVDVITGLIKANVPTRIAFSVSSQIDSRTIIDIGGAEKLLGRGDMLFLENGSSKPVRLQGTFVSDEEIDAVVAHVREQRAPEYLFEQEELLKKAQITEDEDELFYEACEFVVDQKGASTSSLQRRFKIGYNRAARLMDLMEKQGFISGANGSKPREVFISESDLESIQEAN